MCVCPFMLVHDDVAGEQRPELGLGFERRMRQRRVARAEDQVRLPVDVQLVLEGRLHVNLAEHAEALGGQLLAYAGDGVCEREVGGGGQGVAAVNLGHAASSSLCFAWAAFVRCSEASVGSM